jgi:hypothetical protein
MKNALIVSGILAVMTLAVALYFLFNGQTPSDQAAGDTAATSTVVAEPEVLSIKGTGSLESLLSGGQSLECNISYQSSVTAAPTEGTYFTAGGRLRGDFVVPEMASGSVSSLIMRDNTLYTWSVIEGETYGMKIDMAALAEAEQSDTAPDTNEPVPLDAPVNYDCKTWTTIDKSIFEIPTDVLFTNYSDIMNMGMEFSTIYEEAPTGDTATQCELCQKVKGEAKKACLAQFKCE